MILIEIITQYITYRKSLGEKFKTNETCLKAFCKKMGGSTKIKDLTENRINEFLYENVNEITSGWFVKHTAILGLYKYALTRNYVDVIPLPQILPKRPQPFIPYIYSQDELKLIFNSALNYAKNKSHISPYTVQTILFITYALGLRIHETLSITLNDIDIDNSVITIQESKFYKSRLTPFNLQIKEVIEKYLKWKKVQKQALSPETFLFLGKGKKSINTSTMNQIFQRIREKTGIKREAEATYQPRIHDLRHTFAVNRLTSWYQENKNVQQLLPILSVYLGHKNLVHTSVYLTMTDDILQEAKVRFEKYAIGEQH